MMSLTILLAFVPAADAGPADTWPGFRNDGTGVTRARAVPLTWSARDGVAWKAHLPGYGQSSPVVWKGRVFLTAVEGKDKETGVVAAYDAATGRSLWAHRFATSRKGRGTPMVSRAAPTPVVDADGLYAFFEGGDLLALGHDGRVRWRRSLTGEYGDFDNNHGLASSPAQTATAVIVLVDHRGPSYLLAADKATGKNVWKAERASRSSWASPVVAAHGGRELVVVSSGGTVDAYDAADGRLAWSHGGLTGNAIPSAAVAGDRVLVGASESRTNADLLATARSNCCLRLVTRGGAPGYEVAWQGRKAICHHASPLAHAGHVYLVDKLGMVHCLDLTTGEGRYAERLDNPCWATPVGAGGHVFFFGKDGVTTVLKAGPKFVKVASNRLWSDEEVKARKDADAKQPENQARPGPTRGKPGKPGGPPVDPETARRAAYEALGDVVYGAAVVDGAIFLRTGTELYGVRGAGR